MIKHPGKQPELKCSELQKPLENRLRAFLLLYALSLMLWLFGRDYLSDQYLPIRWANFIAPWLALTTFTIALHTAIKRRWLPLAALLITLGSIISLTSMMPGRVNSPALASTSNLSVLSFNIGRFNRKYQEVADLISTNPADIIFLQEVSFPYKLSSKLTTRRLGADYHRHIDKKTGLLILSRTPIRSVHRLRGVLTNYRISHPAGSISLWNIHVPRSIWSTKRQSRTIASLMKDLERHPGPKIIAGDFNLTPYNDAIEKISSTLSGAKTAPSNLFTYPTPIRLAGLAGPWVQIDHILTSRHFSRHNLKRIKNYAGSDHYPISIQLKLRGNAYTGLGKTGRSDPGSG